MPMTTYAELQTALSNRLDGALSNFITDCITLAETYVNTEPRLRVREAETSATLTPTAGVCTLPTDYAMFREVWSGTTELELATPEYVRREYASAASGYPCHFTIVGTDLTPYPTTTSSVGIIYYRKAAALSNSNTTNWLLTAFPSVYMYASLIQTTPFTRDDEAGAVWFQALEIILNRIKANDEGARYARIRSHVRGPTP